MNYSVCFDCFVAMEYTIGDALECITQKRYAACVAAWAETLDVNERVQYMGYEHDVAFSAARCECCNSQLAGQRYTYASITTQDNAMKLYSNATGNEVRIGDTITMRDGERATVVSMEPPRASYKSGYVTAMIDDGTGAYERRYYASVFDCTFR